MTNSINYSFRCAALSTNIHSSKKATIQIHFNKMKSIKSLLPKYRNESIKDDVPPPPSEAPQASVEPPSDALPRAPSQNSNKKPKKSRKSKKSPIDKALERRAKELQAIREAEKRYLERLRKPIMVEETKVYSLPTTPQIPPDIPITNQDYAKAQLDNNFKKYLDVLEPFTKNYYYKFN